MKVLLTFLAFCGFIYASRAYVSEKDVLKEEWEAFKLEFKKFYGETEDAFKMKGFMENKLKIAQHNRFYFKDRNSKKAQYILKPGQDYGNKKLYEETEDAFRMKVFMENKHKIARHNQLYSKGKKTYSLAMNKFGDLLHHEFVQTMNGFKRNYREIISNGSTYLSPANVVLPDYVNWTEKGYVTPVKDQGHCGSCWSFSATGALEGQHFRKTGKLVSLSEQNLIDCSAKYGNEGCNGGLMDQAFEYIEYNHGIDTEESYPYRAKQGRCHYKKSHRGATDTGYVDIPSGDETKLMEAVATVGPISVAIDASHESFQFYSHGVYNEVECDSKNLDHGVLVVGYGTTEDGEDYWLVKNSWGTVWGDQGYIKMSRNKDNQCGIASQASYPLV